jgi:DNA-binding FadR family transcriptional regulator
VRIKTGRSGGAYVQQPGGSSVADSVNLVIRGQQIRISALLETREAIEPQCARLAAKYRTDHDLEILEAADKAIAAQGKLAKFLQANVDWHVAVAKATHNELLSGFMVALSGSIYAATDNKGFVDAEVRATAAKAHESITRAIRDQDAEAAVRRMQRHVHGYAEAVLPVEERTAVEVD